MGFLRNFGSALLPDPAFHLARSAKTYVQDRSILRRHVQRVRAHFPDLRFTRARLISTGFCNEIVTLDDHWIFRFPRHEWRHRTFLVELRLLEVLRTRTSVALPDYRHVAPGSAFGGYSMIRGAELTPALFAGLDRATQESVLAQYAQFLSALHALPVSFASSNGNVRIAPDPENSREWYSTDMRPDLSRNVDSNLLSSIDRFYENYLLSGNFHARLIYCDVQPHHLLLDGDKLGIIDFGEISAGDPAMDFHLLNLLPDWAAPFVFDRYAFRDEQNGLLERAKWCAAHYLTERLWRNVRREGHSYGVAEIQACLKAQLAKLGV